MISRDSNKIAGFDLDLIVTIWLVVEDSEHIVRILASIIIYII